MSRPSERVIPLRDEDATTALGAAVAPRLIAGDTLLLEGGLGAGKSHFARAIIQARLAALGRYEDVPSPTFTLIQSYDAGDVEIVHADLYRLGGPEDCVELGLDAAFDTAICLIEWPDRLGADAVTDAVTVSLAPLGTGRQMTVTGPEHHLARLFGPKTAARDD